MPKLVEVFPFLADAPESGLESLAALKAWVKNDKDRDKDNDPNKTLETNETKALRAAGIKYFANYVKAQGKARSLLNAKTDSEMSDSNTLFDTLTDPLKESDSGLPGALESWMKQRVKAAKKPGSIGENALKNTQDYKNAVIAFNALGKELARLLRLSEMVKDAARKRAAEEEKTEAGNTKLWKTFENTLELNVVTVNLAREKAGSLHQKLKNETDLKVLRKALAELNEARRSAVDATKRYKITLEKRLGESPPVSEAAIAIAQRAQAAIPDLEKVPGIVDKAIARAVAATQKAMAEDAATDGEWEKTLTESRAALRTLREDRERDIADLQAQVEAAADFVATEKLGNIVKSVEQLLLTAGKNARRAIDEFVQAVGEPATEFARARAPQLTQVRAAFVQERQLAQQDAADLRQRLDAKEQSLKRRRAAATAPPRT